MGFREHLILDVQRTYNCLNELLSDHPLSFFRLSHLPEGYAFIQAYDLGEAFEIMAILNNKPCDGVQLRCEFSRSTTTAMKRVLGRVATEEDIPSWDGANDNFPASLREVQQYRSAKPDGYYPASRRHQYIEPARGNPQYDEADHSPSEDEDDYKEEEDISYDPEGSWGANWGNKLSPQEERILHQAQEKLSPYERTLQQKQQVQQGEAYKFTIEQQNRFQAKEQARINQELSRECALLKKQQAHACP